MVSTQKRETMDLFIQYPKMVLKWTLQIIRGITLLSSLGKLFRSLIYNRIENEIEGKDILSPSQVGFRKKHFLV